jgi:hypothetical protein
MQECGRGPHKQLHICYGASFRTSCFNYLFLLLQYKPKYGYKPFPNWLTPLAHFVYFGGFCIFLRSMQEVQLSSHPSVLLRSSFGHLRSSPAIQQKAPRLRGVHFFVVIYYTSDCRISSSSIPVKKLNSWTVMNWNSSFSNTVRIV